VSNRRKKPPPSLRATVAERAEQAAREAAAPRERRRRLTIIVASLVAGALVIGLTALVVTRGSGAGEVAAIDPTARALGCTSCHSVDGSRREGPTWKGLWGSEVTLTDGSRVVADEAYVRRAIEDPAAQVRQGFAPSMPTLEVTEDQLDALVAAIRSLEG
jgi:cytochrome c oxidase subunit 2